MVAMAKRLQNSVTQEVDRFAALPLDQLHYSGLDRSVMQFLVKESLGTLARSTNVSFTGWEGGGEGGGYSL